MKKYLAIIPVLAVAFAFTVAPAFAGFRYHSDYRSNDKVEVDNWNNASVHNNIDADSNTGRNDANGNGRLGRIDTGVADALAGADTTANSNDTRINVSRYDRVEVDNANNARVYNNVDADANTGINDANGNGSSNMMPSRRGHHHMPIVRSSGRGVINTGDALSTATAVNMLNSNVTRINN